LRVPDVFQLFDVVMSGWFLLALFCGTAVLTYALATRIHRTDSVHASDRLSPLWLLVPLTASVLTSPLASPLPGVERIFDMFVGRAAMWVGLQLALFIIEAVLIFYVLWRRRLWPSLVVPFTLVLGVWEISVAITDLALMIGPLVR